MNSLLRERSVWEQLKTCGKPVVLYGMGDGADKVLAAFDRFGIRASAVMASDAFVRGQSFHGFRVRTLAEVENEFDEVFRRNGDMEDDEIFAYQGHEVFLDKLVMSYAVMALPIRFLCREDCPGFEYRDPEAVPSEPGVQYPFAGLQQLLQDNEEV